MIAHGLEAEPVETGAVAIGALSPAALVVTGLMVCLFCLLTLSHLWADACRPTEDESVEARTSWLVLASPAAGSSKSDGIVTRESRSCHPYGIR
ncbi:MAG TPA: hypothetical protein VFF68_05250 [Anaerolineaceae bacterium]|nr:hypothetical protein [Anaerolineaceae bacterium]